MIMADEVEDLTDIQKLQRALGYEREDHKATKTKLRAADATIAERAALGTEPTAAAITTHVANISKANVAAATIEQQRRISELEAALTVASNETATIRAQLTNRVVGDEVRDAATKSFALPNAVGDLIALANLELNIVDGVVQSADGRDVATWLSDKKSTSGYLWPRSVGTGARGSGDAPALYLDNPFRAGASFSLTRQSELARDNASLADRLSREANAA
jgi:hypothetical protein